MNCQLAIKSDIDSFCFLNQSDILTSRGTFYCGNLVTAKKEQAFPINRILQTISNVMIVGGIIFCLCRHNASFLSNYLFILYLTGRLGISIKLQIRQSHKIESNPFTFKSIKVYVQLKQAFDPLVRRIYSSSES